MEGCRYDAKCLVKEDIEALSCGTRISRIGRQAWLDLLEYFVLVCRRRSAIVKLVYMDA